MEESNTLKPMREIRQRILWDSYIWLPTKSFCYGALGGCFAALAMIFHDGGWDPAATKYLSVVGLALMGWVMGIIYGVRHHLAFRKIYGDKWKKE